MCKQQRFVCSKCRIVWLHNKSASFELLVNSTTWFQQGMWQATCVCVCVCERERERERRSWRYLPGMGCHQWRLEGQGRSLGEDFVKVKRIQQIIKLVLALGHTIGTWTQVLFPFQNETKRFPTHCEKSFSDTRRLILTSHYQKCTVETGEAPRSRVRAGRVASGEVSISRMWVLSFEREPVNSVIQAGRVALLFQLGYPLRVLTDLTVNFTSHLMVSIVQIVITVSSSVTTVASVLI